MLRALVLGLAVVVIAGCSKKEEKKSESYTYEFKSNGCTTLKHTATSVQELCTKLGDHTLNNHCAAGQRLQLANEHNCFVVLNKNPSFSDVGHPYQVDKNAAAEHYSYEYDFEDCTTGAQAYSSRAEFCAGLADEARNNNCAKSEREETFKRYNCR